MKFFLWVEARRASGEGKPESKHFGSDFEGCNRRDYDCQQWRGHYFHEEEMKNQENKVGFDFDAVYRKNEMDS